MAVYFDHTATGLIDPSVLSIYCEALEEWNYNPSSRHQDGKRVRQRMTDSLSEIGALLGANPDQIIVTSGGTESINTAIQSVAFRTRSKGLPLVSFRGEHSATIEPLLFLEKEHGRIVHFLPLKEGAPDLSSLEEELKTHPVGLISSIWVNNETGALSDLQSIGSLRKKYGSECRIHVDGVQALGKIPIHFNQEPMDYLSLSLHKVGAPKGIGLMLTREPKLTIPLIRGGGQQGGLRSGTENPPLVIAANAALQLAEKRRVENWQQAEKLHTLLFKTLVNKGLTFRTLSPESAVPHIQAIYIPDLRAETILNGLTAKGFDFSIGSACSTHQKTVDSGLLALGLTPEESRHVIRVSLSRQNTEDEVLQFAENLSDFCRQFSTL